MKITGICAMLLLLLVGAVTVSAEDVPKGAITGKWITKKNGPMAGGRVLLFNEASGPPPIPDRYWRVPDEMVNIGHDGAFTAELAPGDYYLGTMKRLQGDEIGPPHDGDFFFFSRDNAGKPRLYHVKSGEKTDAGTISEAKPFKWEPLKPADGITAIEGTITDTEGKPVAGVLIFAYLSSEMYGKPLFVSPKTGPDGKYLLRVSEGGEYFLKIRDIYGGGKPETGALMGVYGGDPPAPVVVKSGSVKKGVDITGTRFAGRGNPSL
jgi:hypothetical protein